MRLMYWALMCRKAPTTFKLVLHPAGPRARSIPAGPRQFARSDKGQALRVVGASPIGVRFNPTVSHPAATGLLRALLSGYEVTCPRSPLNFLFQCGITVLSAAEAIGTRSLFPASNECCKLCELCVPLLALPSQSPASCRRWPRHKAALSESGIRFRRRTPSSTMRPTECMTSKT